MHVWKGAVLITKAGRIVIPVVIAGVAAVVGLLAGKTMKSESKKIDKGAK